MRDVAIADELRKLHPDLEIDWLAQHPVTAVLEDARRADPPAERGARLGIGAHHGRIVRPRPQRLPGDPPHGRDPRRQLHGLPRRRRERRVRPRHRRRGVGRRPLPPREPGAQAHGVRLDDRLRRLAADARRRRARGVPDGRLQRRDDRARRALPAHPRPGDLRRRPRRHRARRLRAGPAARSATGPSATTRSAATSPGSTRRRSSSGREALRRELGYHADERVVDRRPSAAPASARRCCAGSSRATRRPRAASTGCG